MDEMSTQVTIAGLVVYLMQFLKKTPLVPWVTENTGTLTRVLGVLLAAVTAAGMTYTWDNGTLMITGITLQHVGMFGWTMAKSLVAQEVIYRAAVKAPEKHALVINNSAAPLPPAA